MKKAFYYLSLIFLIVSCKNDPTLCDCVKAGERVNEISASFFKRDYSIKGRDSLDMALDYRDSICEPYQNMPPDELSEAASECPGLDISPVN